MIIENIEATLPEGNVKIKVQKFEESDRKKLYNLLLEWQSLCNVLKELDPTVRGTNTPELLSEAIFCLSTGCARKKRFLRNNCGAKTSFDCINLKTNKRIQVKATSTLDDLSTFGPKSVWDELYLVDLYNDGDCNGDYDIFFIDYDIHNHMVNSTETFRDQQKRNVRPHLSLRQIISGNELAPIISDSLNR